MIRQRVRKYLILMGVFLILVASITTSALADCGVAILDFESLRVVDSNTNHTVGDSYSEDGMTLTAFHTNPGKPHLDYAGTLSTSFAGSTMLFNGTSMGEIRLTRSDGELFDFLSMSLAELPSFDATGLPINFGPFDVTFIGTKKNGRSVSFTATVQPFPETNTFKFRGFSQLTSVVWHQGAGGGPGLSTHQFDNIVVRFH